MIVSHSRRFVFVHIHKTGGESVTAALMPYLDAADLVMHHTYKRLPRDERRRFTRYRTLEKHSTVLVIQEALTPEDWRDFYKFTFVRDPIDRVISYYNYCARQTAIRARVRPGHALYHTPRGRRKDPFRWPAVRAIRRTQSFSDFIRDETALSDPGMRTQYEFLRGVDGSISLDFVGRFESFERDFRIVQGSLDIPLAAPPWTNVTPRQLVNRTSVSADDLTYLTKLYEPDFEIFGYTPPG